MHMMRDTLFPVLKHIWDSASLTFGPLLSATRNMLGSTGIWRGGGLNYSTSRCRFGRRWRVGFRRSSSGSSRQAAVWQS